jgi:hypothetical protein
MEIPKEIACTKCGSVKPLTDEFFTPCKGYRLGFTRWCRSCISINSTEWNREKRNHYRAEHAARQRGSHIDFYRAREFAREMKKYGTTTEWYRDRLIEQCGLCAICGHLSHHHGELQRLQVDHNHLCCDLKTKSCGKCLRGLLCADCNMLLGYLEQFLQDALVFPMLGKSDSWVAKALRYLNKFDSSAPRRA